MNNTDIIKNSLLHLLIPKEENPYKEVFLNAWKTSFINSIILLEKLEKVNLTKRINRESLKDMSFEQALNKYEDIINAWTPDKTIDVFWITGLKAYDINQYAMLKGIFQKYHDTLYNELISLSSKNKTENNEILLKLATNSDLTKKQYQNFELNHISLVKDKIANIDDVKLLYKIGKIYNSDMIWKNYIQNYIANQIFVHKVKDFLNKENIEYLFKDEDVDMFSKNKFTKTMYLNPEYVCKYNKKITASLLDTVILSLNNYYLKIAKEIENNAEMSCEYIKSGNRIAMIHFNDLYNLQIYEKKIEEFNFYFKKIVENIKVNKNKSLEIYLEEIDKLYLYYKMDDKYDNKKNEKRLKI